jgi:DNA-binding response OmpR family regulator
MARRRPLNVLIIDDHHEFGESIRSVLEAIGCAVDVASTPYAGITLSDTTRYDLVLVDLRMPQMGGVEVLSFLRPRGHRCTLVVSAFVSDVNRDEVFQAGAEGIMQKPIDVDRLLRVVKYVARNRTRDRIILPIGLADCALGPEPVAAAA